MSITNGVVSIEDGTKASEEYAPARKVRVELHFDLPENCSIEDEQRSLDITAKIANAKVNELLGRSGKSVPSATAAVVEKATDAILAAEGTKTLTDKDKLAEAAGVLHPAPTKGPKRKPKEAATEKAKEPEQTDLEDFTSVPAAKAAEPDPDDLTTIVPTVEVTDQGLADAVQARNKAIENPVKIRTLIGTYNPDPTKAFTLKEIAQAHRQEFLTKLAALTKD
jgi:hypothetical protein